MTTKQLEIVRELRLYHTPSLFMEAAAELERLWLENAHQKEQLAIERGRVDTQARNVAELIASERRLERQLEEANDKLRHYGDETA